ncbi:MAG: hypothetical protein E7551_07285 [Ruminococcaceae bacterium]|nr:hypothetical protein [Oscillospiraceae bacterium]
MLRGTNKSIIEISETENKYFEKAILFVKPEFVNLSPERLSREAKRMIGTLTFSPMGLGRQVTARRRAAQKRRRKILFISGVLFLTAAFIVWKMI